MRVLGGADNDGVDLACAEGIVELAEVAEFLRLGKSDPSAVEVLAIHIAEGDDVFTWLDGRRGLCASVGLGLLAARRRVKRDTGELLDVCRTATTHADKDEIHFLVW